MSSWVLVILIYSVAHGHGLADATYRDRVEIGPFQSLDDCKRSIPQVRFWSFPHAEDVSYDLHEVRCEKVGK